MPKALVLYHSQEFGNTSSMAEAAAEGLGNATFQVHLFNTNDGRFDVTQFPQYDCVAFGSPDYYSDITGGLNTVMDDHYIYDVCKGLDELRGRPYILFYSHGGGDRVKDVMPRIFRRIGTQIVEPVGSRGKPDTQVLEKCRALGKELVKVVLSKYG